VPVAHACNPSYLKRQRSGGSQFEAWANSLRDPTLKKINHKNRASGVAQGVGPEFKPHSTKKKKFLTNAIY
jgi:hypothetical protein